MKLVIALFIAGAAWAQNTAPLQVRRIFNITSGPPTICIDNRSAAIAQMNYHSFIATGSGTWSVQIQYSQTGCNGPWTSYGGLGLVTQATANGIGFGQDGKSTYRNFISFAITGSGVSLDYSGTKDFYLSTASSGSSVSSVFGRTGAVVAATGDYTAAQVTNAFDTTANNTIGPIVNTQTDVSTPTNPTSGHTKIYTKNGTWCALSSLGLETCTGAGTALIDWVSQVTNKPFVDVRTYNFSAQQPGGSLSIGSNTTTLTPCPAGVAGADTNHPYRISGGTGTAETVTSTGGTCTSGASSGTLIFTAVNTHTGAWTIASATAGLTEAYKANASGGNILFFPAGTYNFFGRTLITTAGIMIEGAGPGITNLVANGGISGGIIGTTSAGTNSSFKSFTCDGNRAATGIADDVVAFCLFLSGDSAVVSNVELKNSPLGAIFIGDGATAPKHFLFDGNYIHDNGGTTSGDGGGIGIFSGGVGTSSDIRIVNSRFEDNHNTVALKDSAAINLTSSQVLISGNYFKNNHNLNGGQVYAACGTGLSDWMVADNVIDRTTSFMSDITGGIELCYVGNGVVVGNVVNGASGVALAVQAASTNVTVTGNTVNGALSGIQLSDNGFGFVSGVTLSGNRITNATTGILIDPNTTQVLASSNNLVGSTTAITNNAIATSIYFIGNVPIVPLAVLQGGTGTATPSLVAGTNVSITGAWPNQTVNSTGGGGASALYAVTDFQVVKNSGSVETMNTAAGASTPVTGGVGRTSYTFTGAATLTISGTSSTGPVSWCFRSDGSLAAVHNLAATLTGSGITVIPATSVCPSTSKLLWTTTMTGNVWDAIAETMDKRPFLSWKPSPIAGSFMSVTQGDTDTIAFDTTTLTNPSGTKIATSTGSLTTNNCIKANASGDFVDAGTTCGGGGGTTEVLQWNVPVTANLSGTANFTQNVSAVGTFATFENTTTWSFKISYLQSQANTDYMVYPFIWPSGTISNFDVKLMVISQGTSGNTVIHSAQLQCEAAGSTIGAGSLGTASTSTQTGVTNLQWFMASMTAVSTTGCSAGNQAYLKITRSGTFTGSIDYQSFLIAITRTLP